MYHEGVGTGNDFYGWEFYKDVKVAWASVVTEELTWETPSPSHMYWGPDRLVVEYELTSPYISGEFEGWCKQWQEGSDTGDTHWVDIPKEECWQRCEDDLSCWQAVYEVGKEGETKCWTGLNKMTEAPDGWNRPEGTDYCYAKNFHLETVNIREEKFISLTDVMTTTITSDRAVTLRLEGRSFQSANSLSLNGSCAVDVASNSILVREGGTVTAKVSEKPEVLKEAVLMYDGMTGVLSSDKPLEDVTIHDLSPGLCGYTFSLPLDSQGLSLAWTMSDNKDIGFQLLLKSFLSID